MHNKQTRPKPEEFNAAIQYVKEGIQSGRIAASLAKGILYSMTETIGVIIGDIDLPSHLAVGYQGVLEEVIELNNETNNL